jgi:hypothetical protein
VLSLVNGRSAAFLLHLIKKFMRCLIVYFIEQGMDIVLLASDKEEIVHCQFYILQQLGLEIVQPPGVHFRSFDIVWIMFSSLLAFASQSRPLNEI